MGGDLVTPPKPPLTNTAHILPFDKLSPLDFERLCLWLVEREGYVRAEHLGLAGSEQGRDVIAYKPAPGGDELWYFQCKRYASIRAKTLKDEVDKYLALAEEKPELRPVGVVFVVSCAISAKVREEVGAYCEQHSLAHEVWALTELDMHVKQYPDLLAEFFGLPSLPNQPKVYHNLPQPDYGTFIGREEELAQVTRILRPYPHSQHPLVTIDGIGGIGKSALALEVAHRYLRDYAQLPKEERFDVIIWTSAKSSVLTADGIKPRQQITRTLDDIYTTIAVALDREDITRARTEEQDELVTRALIQQRTLLVVDNLETVDDERVNAFLRELPAPTKAIVTTRHRIDVAYPIRLTGLPEEDGLALVAQESEKKSVKLTAAEQKKLYTRTGGVPLAIVWSVAQMGFGYSAEAVLRRLGQPTGDVARFCFEGALECIRGTGAHKMLMALSLFATDASREALGYVTNLPSLDRDDSLVTLERLSLVNGKGGRFWILPLTHNYAQAELSKDEAWESFARKRWSDYLLSLLDKLRKQGYPGIGAFVQERTNLLDFLEWLWGESRYDQYIECVDQIEFFLWALGDWKVYQDVLTRALKASVQQGELDSQARTALRLGAKLLDQGDFQQSLEFIQQARVLFEELGDDTYHAEALRMIGWALAKTGDLDGAQERLEEAMTSLRRMKDNRHISRVERALGFVYLQKGEYQTAREHLLAARALREKDTSSSGGLGVTYRLLGEVALAEGNLAEAQQYLEHSLFIADKLRITQTEAETKLQLAVLEARKGNGKDALKLVKEALEIFQRLGMKEDIARAETLLQDLDESH